MFVPKVTVARRVTTEVYVKNMAILPMRNVCRQFITKRRFYHNLLNDFESNSIGTEQEFVNRGSVNKNTTCPLHFKDTCTGDIQNANKNVKAFQCVPAPKGLPLVGTAIDIMRSGGASMIHEYCDRRHKELGPIYRERLGSVEAVFVAEKNLILHVYRNEGKYPKHLIPEPWLIYNKIYGKQRGLFFMDGDAWLQRRKSLNKVFMKQESILENTTVFNDVISELLDRWLTIRDGKGNLPNLEKELYNWSIESLGRIIFGRRLGCLQSEQLRNIHEFAHCVQQIFIESARMTMIPPKLAYTFSLPVWRRFVRAANRALELARSYVEENVKEITNYAEKGEIPEGILNQALLQEKVDGEEIVRIIMDLFVAAADTTSHATQWTLYLLAKHPRCQQVLLNDIKKVVRPGEILNEKHLLHIPYVKAIIKEALRLYPVAPFLTRILSKDIILGGYEIPKDTLILISLYTMGRNPKYFNEPSRFIPERWIRNSEISSTSVVDSHAFLPFGLGARSCIGRRVAELQMQLLIARLIQTFVLQLSNDEDVNIKLRMITTPDRPINLRLVTRE